MAEEHGSRIQRFPSGFTDKKSQEQAFMAFPAGPSIC